MSRYYKTELHAHTSPASECSDIDAKSLVELYKGNGYDSVVVTNHFTNEIPGEDTDGKIKLYLQDYYKCREYGEAVGLNIIFGAELRFTENKNDYLIFGISPEELPDIYKLLSCGIDAFYREYKNEKNIILQAHPFRDGMESVSPSSLDGIEVFNMHPNHNSRIGIAAKYAKKNNMIATCGSDFHHFGHECLCGILTEKPLEDSFDVSEVLRNRAYRMCIADYEISL